MKLLFSHNENSSIIITMEVDDLPIELEVADALKSRTPDDGYGRELYRRKDCQHDNLHGGQLGILHRGAW